MLDFIRPWFFMHNEHSNSIKYQVGRDILSAIECSIQIQTVSIKLGRMTNSRDVRTGLKICTGTDWHGISIRRTRPNNERKISTTEVTGPITDPRSGHFWSTGMNHPGWWPANLTTSIALPRPFSRTTYTSYAAKIFNFTIYCVGEDQPTHFQRKKSRSINLYSNFI